MKKRSELSGSPSAFVFGCGGFGDVDGLLQSAAQVDSPLLDHLPDVFDPVLFVLDAGGLRGDTSAGQTGHIYRNYGWPNSERLLLDPPTQNKVLDFKRAIISHEWFDLWTCAWVTPPYIIDCKMTKEFRQEGQKWPPIISLSASPSPRDTALHLWGYARLRLQFPFSLSNKRQRGCSGSGLHKTQIRTENGCALTRCGKANVQSFHSPPFVLLNKNETFLTHGRETTPKYQIWRKCCAEDLVGALCRSRVRGSHAAYCIYNNCEVP